MRFVWSKRFISRCPVRRLLLGLTISRVRTSNRPLIIGWLEGSGFLRVVITYGVSYKWVRIDILEGEHTKY